MRDNDNRYPSFEQRAPSTNSNTLPEHPANWRPGAFGYERLDAFAVAREALGLGDRLARRLPRGYGKLGDQLRRALLSTYLGIAEGASRTGADRLARFGCWACRFHLPKLYLECGHCSAPGVSITRLLTGLHSGDTSAELKLNAAYLSAEHTYGKAGRDLGVHYGEAVERTLVRRLALEVEKEAVAFAEKSRNTALEPLSNEGRRLGVARLMLQGDGGSVRTGILMACEPGDPGYGKKSPKLGKPKRKRVSQGREIITLDVREPGETTASALDVVVPHQAGEGERSRRMLALAARKNLGSNTQMNGLGDMGSSLPAAFAEAFVDYDAFYSAAFSRSS